MEFAPTEDQIAFQNAARDFARRELTPNAARWDAECFFPRETIALAGELGFCAVYTPEEMGGLGLSRLDASFIFEELAAGCTSTAAYMTIHNMATWMIATWGSDALKTDWGADLSSARKLASYCLTEPGAGSDAASLQTTARRSAQHYHINGSKVFSSGAGATELLLVMARTGEAGAKGVTAFAVPADSAGVSYGRKEAKMGWNSQPTRSITFEDVRVPLEYRLGGEGEGFKIAMRGLDGGRVNIATCSVGTAQTALAAARGHLQQRRQFGRALADFQALQFKFADMATELVAARQLVRLAAWKLDRRDPDATTYCAMAKRLATDIGFRVCDDALQLYGGYGYIREYPLERHVRDTRVHRILEGTNEIMRVIIARRLLREGATEEIR